MLDPKGREAARLWAINAASDGGVPGDDYIDGILTAYLSTVTPAEVGGLVERLKKRPVEGEYVLQKWAREREDAASLIQSQAARIAELEAGLETIAVFPNPPTVSQARARALLNGERKEEPQPTSRALRRDDWHYDSDGYCDNPGRGY